VAASAGQHSAGLVWDVGGLDRGPGHDPAVRMGMRARHPATAIDAPVLRRARNCHAGTACPGGEPLHALQPDLDWALCGRRRLAHFAVAAKRALAIASSRARTVIISFCTLSLRCRFSNMIRLMTTHI